MLDARRVAIFLPNWVGDVVMATPAIRALKARFASASFTLVGRRIALDVLAGGPGGDGTLLDVSREHGGAGNLLRTIMQVRRGRFDLAVLLPNSFRSAAIAWFGGAMHIAGYNRDGRGLFLSHKLSPPRGADGKLATVSALDYYCALAEMLGADCSDRGMSLPVAPADEQAAEALLADAGIAAGPRGAAGRQPLVMLNPGASFGPSKLWPADRFAAVADALVARCGARVIINAAPGEEPIAREVAACMKHPPALNLAGRANSIGLLKALLSRADLLVTNDTGARHVAAACGAAVVTIFGSTDPAWADIRYSRERQVRVQVPCGPCQQKVCPNPPGPLMHQCMLAVRPEMVLAACLELLEGAAK